MVKRKRASLEGECSSSTEKKGMPTGSSNTTNIDAGLKRARETDQVDEKVENGPFQKQGGGASLESHKPEVCNGHQIIEHRSNLPFLRSSVKRPKRDNTPPPKPKEQGKEKVKVEPKAERKRWEAWSTQDKILFFKFLNEHGKDFDAIQKHIELQHKKKIDPSNQVKNKDQVRHLYYRTLHKIAKFIDPKTELSKTARELYALINYGELRKKIKTGMNAKYGQKLNELVNNGVTTVRFQGKNVRIKTPVCKALKKLQDAERPQAEKPFRLPLKILIDLQPRNNEALATVQCLAHNPRLRIAVPVQKDVKSVIEYLTSKWTPHSVKLLQSLKPTDKDHRTNIILRLPPNLDITPYEEVRGKFIHWSAKTPFTMGQGFNNTSSSNSKNCHSNLSSPQSTTKLKLPPSKTLPVEATSVKSDTKGKVKENVIVTNGLQKKDDMENLANNFDNRLPDISMIQTEVCGQFGETHSETLLGLNANTDSDHLLKCPESSLGDSNDAFSLRNVGNTEPSLAQLCAVEGERMCKRTKDSCLRNGLTLENADDISITDLYLMLGMPPRLKFEYEFASQTVPQADNTLNTLQKLVHLAKTQLTNTKAQKQKQKQKMVSVGTVTSPVRGIQPAANSATNKVGAVPSRSKNDVAAAPGANKEIVRIAGVVGNGNLTPNGPVVEKDMGLFVTPKASFAPSVLKSQAQEKLFMQQLNFIHRQSINQRKGRKTRPPIVVQRHLLPRLQSSGPIRNMMSLSTSTGKFTPVDASALNTVDPSCPKIKLKPVSRSPVPIAPNIPISLSRAPPVVISPILNSPISSPVSFVTNSPSPVTVPQTMQISAPVAVVPISAAASVMPIVAAPSTPCPIVAIPVTTNQVYAQQVPPVTSVAATPPQNKVCDSSVLSTPSPPSNDANSADSHAKDGQSSFSLSPPPNLSSILDISLPSADAPEDTSIGGESLIAMAMDTAGLTGIDQPLTSETSKTSTPGGPVQNNQQENREAGTSTPPPSTVSPTSSPFKQLTSDPHWLNGETMDLSSLSGFLNGIESPEKRDKAAPTLNSICPLPVMYCESSRDSIMSTSNFQVEGTLQSLMNENSIDYMAKFADLAAHIEESVDLPGNLGVNETVAMEPTKDGVTKALDFSSVDFGSGKLNNGLKSVS